MKKCELFVLPSLQEGFPKSLLEAMACGKPVITTKNLKEIVDGGGITVETTNVEELMGAIKRIISSSSSERTMMGDKGRRLVEQNWSWEIVGRKIEGVYNSLIK